ncbi:Ankyrin repeat and KH domain-containing protein mask [Gryllus bimaculatus]|nr:Ankyrin repeat and KH domain-containing protein mask [Gryllus bimaculatus]
MLLETKVKLVWVSSRPEAELVLTKALHCATSSLRPFSEEEQKNHLCEHWSSADPRNRPPAAFEGLAAEMVAALHGAAGRGQRSLLDVPLHAQMAAEAYATQAARALGTGVSLLPQSGVSLYQLYRRFVQRKRDLYERRFGLNDANSANLPSADNFEVVHQNCAMLVLKTGILWLGEGEDETPHFLHYTFIEYFAARWLLDNQEEAPEAVKEIWRSLLNRDVGVGVRHILEHMLSDGLPLHRAVLEGSEGALEAGGDADESDRFGRTALVQAASLGRADAVGSLLAKGCDPGRGDALLGWTALRYASACGHHEAAERLLQAGADPDHFVTHVDVRDLVFKAAEQGYPAIMKMILKKKRSYTNARFERRKTPIMIAAENRHTKTVQILLKYGADVTKKDVFNRQPIHFAFSGRQIEITKLLLEKKADPNAVDEEGETPLMKAARAGDAPFTELLLEHGADVSRRDENHWTALHYACKWRHYHITKILLESKAGANAESKRGKIPLMIAVWEGDAQSTELLLEHGADVSQRDENLWTALHYATRSGHHQIMKLLLENKADPNAVDKWRKTPLMVAARDGDAQSTELLLEHGADVSQRDENHWTALHYATRSGHRQITKLLLENKADPNAVDKKGKTPLMKAASEVDDQSTELLLEHGANISPRNKRNSTDLQRRDCICL